MKKVLCMLLSLVLVLSVGGFAVSAGEFLLPNSWLYGAEIRFSTEPLAVDVGNGMIVTISEPTYVVITPGPQPSGSRNMVFSAGVPSMTRLMNIREDVNFTRYPITQWFWEPIESNYPWSFWIEPPANGEPIRFANRSDSTNFPIYAYFGTPETAPRHIVGITTAEPTAARVLVDGVEVAFQAYYINGYNHFRLRDVAYVLNGTAAQFNVEWNAEHNDIRVLQRHPYEPVGGVKW